MLILLFTKNEFEVVDLIFIATLTHSPEMCFADKQNQEESKKYIKEFKKNELKLLEDDSECC